MFKRKPTGDVDPYYPPANDSIWQRQVHNIVETQLARYPLLFQLRAIWRQLRDEREGWLYIIPLLLIVGVGTYRAERKRLRAR